MDNIKIDYERVEHLCMEVNPSNGGGFQEIIAGYEASTDGITKSAGEMLESIKTQITMEKAVVEAMSKTCLQLVGSIDVAAKSFQNTDGTMAKQING